MKHWKAGAYLRLSKEDEKSCDNESLSISNQRDMIISYINNSLDIELIDIYVDDFVAIRNIFNEFYPKDISKKVKTVLKNNQQAGKYMGAFACYGYRKSETDKHQLIIDDFINVYCCKLFI